MTVDLSTDYLGLRLKSPLVVSACPLTGKIESLRRLEARGAAAVVLPSLFEEQVEHLEVQIAKVYDYQIDATSESLSFFPEMESYNTGPDRYLLHLSQAKSALQIPVIASLNGISSTGWIRYARYLEEAGADALELNVYFVPTDAQMSPHEVEKRYVDIVAAVKQQISIPLAVKIGPYFTNMAHMAQQLKSAGADGLVLFNRYLAPDVDVELLQVEPRLVLSDRHELWTALRWVAILHGQWNGSLAVTGGVQVAEDVIKSLLVGADVTMIASALLRHGPDLLAQIEQDLRTWLMQKEYTSARQLQGSLNRSHCPDPSALERANYTQALTSYTSSYL